MSFIFCIFPFRYRCWFVYIKFTLLYQYTNQCTGYTFCHRPAQHAGVFIKPGCIMFGQQFAIVHYYNCPCLMLLFIIGMLYMLLHYFVQPVSINTGCSKIYRLITHIRRHHQNQRRWLVPYSFLCNFIYQCAAKTRPVNGFLFCHT